MLCLIAVQSETGALCVHEMNWRCSNKLEHRVTFFLCFVPYPVLACGVVPTRCDTSPYSSLILLCASSLFHSEDGDRDKTRQEYCCTGYTDNGIDLESFYFFLLSHFNNHNSWQNRADFVDEPSTKARFWIDRLIVWRTRTVCMKGVCLSLPLLSQVLDFWKISASERIREWESELPPELLWSCQRGDRPPREAPPQSSTSSLSTFCTITTARQESACFVHGDGTRCSQHNSSKYKATFDDFLYTALPFLFRLPLLLSPRHHLHPVLFLHRYRLLFSWRVSNFPTRKNLDWMTS